MSLDDEVRAELAQLQAAHRLRVPRVVDSAQGAVVTLDGKQVLNLASNDYLGLANDERLRRAASGALETGGVGAGASRLIVGNQREHVLLENALADWLRCAGVRLFNSGYAANVGVLQSLLRPGDMVFSDELNHASIIDGCRLSRAEVIVFPHRDHAALERALATRGSARRRIVVSETLFSMDGDVADVAALATIARNGDAALMLDEAHALGVWGPEGRGIAAAAGVEPDVLIGTAGKALGSFGAFAATSRAIADLLWNRARSFVFSTGLPPAVSAATRAAIEVVRGRAGDELRQALQGNVAVLRAALPSLGGHRASAIAPLVVGDDQRAIAMTGELLADGFYVQGIRPPTVPEGTARLRISLTARHASDQVSSAAARLRHFA